jgi:hypothetical protein
MYVEKSALDFTRQTLITINKLGQKLMQTMLKNMIHAPIQQTGINLSGNTLTFNMTAM